MRLIELVTSFLAVAGAIALGGTLLWRIVHNQLRRERKQDEIDKELRF